MSEEQDKEREVYDALGWAIDKITHDQLLYGNWVQPDTAVITSTATNNQPATLNKDELLKAMELIKKGDVLQQKGVGRDWFCVINPALVSPIRELAKKYVTVPPYVMAGFDLDYIMGRRVLIINEAPLNIEYMDEKTARRKYPAHFEGPDLSIPINRVKRIIELNEEVYIAIRTEGEWTFFHYYITENDPEPFQVKKVATKIFDEMDWSYAAALIMQAPPEPKS